MTDSFERPEKEQLVVTQKNELVYAAYEMTVQEKRLLLLAISRLTKANLKFPCWEIPVSQIVKYLGIEQNNAYRDLKRVAIDLTGRVAVFSEEDGGYQTANFARCRYIPASRHPSHSAVLEIKLREEMAPYLLELKGHFQSIPFGYLSGLSSFYAMRLYEILHHARNENGMKKEEIVFSLKELRRMLTIEKKYPVYQNLKTKVLAVAQKQIIERTPMGVSFTEIRDEFRRGQPIIAVKFTVWDKECPENIPHIEAQEMFSGWTEKSFEEQMGEIYKEVEKQINQKAFTQLYRNMVNEGMREEKIVANFRYAIEQIAENPSKIQNFAGFVTDAIRNNYARA